jgi:hypothetical protein
MDRNDVEKARNAEREAGSEETSDFRLPTSDLANLEAMFSSLAPRAAGIDRDRLMFLAGQAAALPLPLGEGRGKGETSSSLPLPLGEGRGEGEALFGMAPAHTASSPDSAALALILSQREKGPNGRWAWPAAFSAMTALAASLLIMLVNRPEPRVIERIVRVPVERAAEIPVPQLAGQDERALESEPAFSPARRQTAYGESYLHSRDQVLAFGLDSWMRTVPPSTASSAEPPASYRELRESLLQ